MKPRTLALAVAAATLIAPPIDAWLDRAMPRLLLVEMPAWLALGWLAARGRGDALRRWDPYGAAGLVLFLGTMWFWMLPRSVDLVGASPLANQLMHLSLLAAGAVLGVSLPAVPFVVRGALGIHAISMTFALGVLYTSYSALLCGTFDLAQQKATGRLLVGLSPVVLVAVVGWGALTLARSHRRREGAAAARQMPSAG
ncbi:MAG: hypothetical protein IT356_12360 [Gemmatimonadaceae bacterium]|nr:hypothetical protein [Gemmatimonadaceae bacterium]